MCCGRAHVELDGAAQEVVRVQVAQHHVAVGHRHRIQPAFRPAGTDPVAGAVRPQLDGLAVRVQPHEAAGAGADRIHRHQRQRQHQAGHVRVGLDGEVALGDQGHVEAGAADVRAGDVLVAQVFAQQLGADHPADGAGDDGAGQLLGLPADGAAVGGHHPQVELGAVLLEAVADLLQRLARGLGP
jgi:hypothetical protein